MKTSLTICFSARSWYGTLTAGLHNSLAELNDCEIQSFFLCPNDKEENYVKSLVKSGTNFRTVNISDFFATHWNEFTYEKFLEFEKKYDVEPIWKYIYTDRFLINCSRDYCIKIVSGYFLFYENLFADNHIDYYYDEAISTIQTFVGYLVGKKLGVKYISQMTARGAKLDRKYHYFLKDPFQLNFELDDTHPLDYYSEEEIKRADEYIKDFEENDLKPICLKINDRNRPRLNKKVFMCLPKYIYMKLNKYNNDPHYYIYYHHFEEAWKPLVAFFRYHKSKKYINEVDYSKKFVYFPLHFQPESSTLSCAQKYEKQLYFIDSLAKGLPADTLLYIKEHGAMLGQRDLSFYKELEHYPNVVLVNPWENSRTLIEKCEAVATLTGTAGFEAMLLRKPVIVAGRILYEDGPGMVKVDDVFDNYTKIMSSWKKPDRNELIRFMCAYFRTLHIGTINFSAEQLHTKENYDLLAGELYKYCISNK